MAIVLPRATHRRSLVTYGVAPKLGEPVDVGERPCSAPTGGGYCPCSGVTEFYTDADREWWEELHTYCTD